MSQGSPTLAVPVSDWIQAGGFRAPWTLRFDMLSVEMVAMVTLVSTLIHIYSVGYMSHETNPVSRFFAYLSLFTFAMLMLVSSDNLIQLFFGWEGVGLASYLLIGYWYDRPSANAAAIKAFVVNRVADLFFMVGIALLFAASSERSATTTSSRWCPHHQAAMYHLFGTDMRAYEVIGVLLFIGAMGKSAQLFLHTWLPDAMEGPTPVSALIHAATMVTAGRVPAGADVAADRVRAGDEGDRGGLDRRLHLLLRRHRRAGAAGHQAHHRILDLLAARLHVHGLPASASIRPAMFHLTTHAFFKALLFLGAGSVIHAISDDEQDMFRMGGLARKLPVTYAVMWIGSLALAGIPPFAGWWSKDAIIDATFIAGIGPGYYGWVLGSLTAFLTALYSGRLLFLVFHGKPRDAQLAEHAHESGPVIMSGRWWCWRSAPCFAG